MVFSFSSYLGLIFVLVRYSFTPYIGRWLLLGRSGSQFGLLGRLACKRPPDGGLYSGDRAWYLPSALGSVERSIL